LIAKHDNKTVGKLTAFLENERCTYEIDIEENYQNSGIARQLLAAMCTEIKTKNPQINLALLKLEKTTQKNA
jgi:hypothetical protein